MRNCSTKFITALAFSTMLMTAAPTEAAELKAAPTVDDTVIRLGDLFDDVGDKAAEIVMQAPAPGEAEKLNSYDLDRIAQDFELDWERPNYLRTVLIHRDGIAFSLSDLSDLVLDAANQQGLQHDVEVTVYGSNRGLYLPTTASLADIEFERFTMTDRMDRFSATLLIPTGGSVPKKLKVNGTLQEVRMVPMLTRLIAPGEVITAKDVTWSQYPSKRLNRNSVLDQQSLVGQTVRRPLQPGQPLRVNDIMAPVVVEKGSLVTMTIQSGALTLSASGRALQDGGDGDMIRVMNIKSKQSVEAQVISPGLVKVMSNSLALAAL
ncbi:MULTISPECIES: flagellar basal body P-ring formation chaperone FlgA [Kordiimonas]|jgi:flagella basal body P-ring formation protein FlgA|uniref:Flagella basal body P-ring formation protein FlgA n=1 Tax=Kordiimonas lacus TaxID=637679 RepID=A0A1G6W1J1_9PROT|nr:MULTISPECIES: flagellar basal body P-ring formation chaperone FlgA [Kordiimonas]SDD58916.1 flagella basal body P-ring formation protein FlgA [Kordiimonas lacus]